MWRKSMVGSRSNVEPCQLKENKMKTVPDNVLLAWAKEIKNWYGIDCTNVETLRRASCGFDRNAYCGRPYDQVFLRNGSKWHKSLDTADREAFADYVEMELSA